MINDALSFSPQLNVHSTYTRYPSLHSLPEMRFLLSLQFLALSFLVAANTHAARRAHDSIARRASGDVGVHLHKRISNARFTFYDVGL